MCVSGYCVGESYFFFLLVFFAFFAFFAFLAILPSVIPKLVQCKSTSTSIRAEYTMIEKLISKASKKVNGGHALRRHEPVTYAIVLKILDGTLKLADKFFLLHPEIKKQPKVHEVPHTFIFRFALCAYLHALHWRVQGGAQDRLAEKMRNDVIDVTYAAYALASMASSVTTSWSMRFTTMAAPCSNFHEARA
jgi:hypothetical protein